MYDLEEACEELRGKEQQLDADLRSADDAFEQAKTHYENLVTALKDARKKLQDERDDALADARDAEEKRLTDRENAKREKEIELEKLRRTLSEREQVRVLEAAIAKTNHRSISDCRLSLIRPETESPNGTRISMPSKTVCDRSRLSEGSWAMRSRRLNQAWSLRLRGSRGISLMPRTTFNALEAIWLEVRTGCDRGTSNWQTWCAILVLIGDYADI